MFAAVPIAYPGDPPIRSFPQCHRRTSHFRTTKKPGFLPPNAADMSEILLLVSFRASSQDGERRSSAWQSNSERPWSYYDNVVQPTLLPPPTPVLGYGSTNFSEIFRIGSAHRQVLEGTYRQPPDHRRISDSLGFSTAWSYSARIRTRFVLPTISISWWTWRLVACPRHGARTLARDAGVSPSVGISQPRQGFYSCYSRRLSSGVSCGERGEGERGDLT
jgi:hypothetical protein